MIRSTRLTLAAMILASGGVVVQRAVSSGRGESSTTTASTIEKFGQSPQSKLVIPDVWPYADQTTETAKTRSFQTTTPSSASTTQIESQGTESVVPNNFVQIRPRANQPSTNKKVVQRSSTKPSPSLSTSPVVPKLWPFSSPGDNLSERNATQTNIAPATTLSADTSSESTLIRSAQRAADAGWWQQPGPVPPPQPLDEVYGVDVAAQDERENAHGVQKQPSQFRSRSSVRPPTNRDSVNVSVRPNSRRAQQKTGTIRRHRDDSRYRASLAVISRHADDHVRYGFTLAEKGAVHSARGEFVEALSIIADALDVEGQESYREALIAGLRALDEANDFARHGNPLESSINFRRLKEIHKTPVLAAADLQTVSPYVVMQRYFAYAERQLAYAGGGVPAASRALYGLGRIQPYLAGQEGPGNTMAGPKGVALHRAALTTDPRNHQAANELGVQLARYGQLQAAADALKHSLSVRQVPEAWHNLARVYAQQGNEAQARLARSRHASLVTAARQGVGSGTGSPTIRWVDPAEFSPPSVDGSIAQSTHTAKLVREPANASPSLPAAPSPIQRIGRLWGRSLRR